MKSVKISALFVAYQIAERKRKEAGIGEGHCGEAFFACTVLERIFEACEAEVEITSADDASISRVVEAFHDS